MDKAPIGVRERSTGPSPEDDPAERARSHRDRLRDDLVPVDGADEHLIHGSGRDAGRMHGADAAMVVGERHDHELRAEGAHGGIADHLGHPLHGSWGSKLRDDRLERPQPIAIPSLNRR